MVCAWWRLGFSVGGKGFTPGVTALSCISYLLMSLQLAGWLYKLITGYILEIWQEKHLKY